MDKCRTQLSQIFDSPCQWDHLLSVQTSCVMCWQSPHHCTLQELVYCSSSYRISKYNEYPTFAGTQETIERTTHVDDVVDMKAALAELRKDLQSLKQSIHDRHAHVFAKVSSRMTLFPAIRISWMHLSRLILYYFESEPQFETMPWLWPYIMHGVATAIGLGLCFASNTLSFFCVDNLGPLGLGFHTSFTRVVRLIFCIEKTLHTIAA